MSYFSDELSHLVFFWISRTRNREEPNKPPFSNPGVQKSFWHIKKSKYWVLMMILLQTLIAGWDELECQRVFSFLCDLTNLLQKIEAVITAKPGLCVRV